ncbi:MAG: nucleotidyltransferase domain-containing protein [bacterium]|nr:nucleotidyltransferase domain-containing protein [bacterium]
MRLENYPSEKLKDQIIKIVGKHLDLSQYKVFFFGSRVSGGGDDRSDIDVGIDGLNPVPLGALLDIKDELDNLPVLYKIDVVDFKDISDQFRQVALEKIEELKIK